MDSKKKQLSRLKLRKAAKLAIAIHAYELMEGFSHNAVGLSIDEYETMAEETHKIAEKLAGNYPMNLGSVDDVINYFRSKNHNNG